MTPEIFLTLSLTRYKFISITFIDKMYVPVQVKTIIYFMVTYYPDYLKNKKNCKKINGIELIRSTILKR